MGMWPSFVISVSDMDTASLKRIQIIVGYKGCSVYGLVGKSLVYIVGYDGMHDIDLDPNLEFADISRGSQVCSNEKI